jgi:2-dehydropantoate 2-reductase
VVGAQRLLAGKSYVGGQVFAPGQVIVGAKGKDTHIGELDGQVTARVTRIAQAFSDAGLQTLVSDNIMGTIWDKLLVNVATGALSGITHLPYGEMYQQPDVEACAVAAVAEAIAVAKAHGIALSVTDPRQPWLKAGAGLPYEFKASMLQSLEKGSITEVDFVNGSVVRWGQKVGVPTPVNQTLVACIKGIEHGLFHSAEAKKRATKSH